MSWDAYRRWGYLQAKLDPLGRLKPEAHPELDDDEAARAAYCGSIGAEFMHIPSPERRRWIQERFEAPAEAVDRERIAERLASAEAFENVLQARYPGTKRFSLEGMTALIPLLDEILDGAAELGAKELVLCMSHRGRLNVMVHVVGRRPLEIFAEFEDVDPRSVLGGSDVKYHVGATGVYTTPRGKSVEVHLASNPSHLEAIDPAAMGRVRAKQARGSKALLVALHGDGAFAGQGIAAETLNLSELRGYSIGGTVHVVLNNLIGFTTGPQDLHSSRFASDVAKRLAVPIFHVNGQDPEAVVRAGRLAVGYRYAFGTDAVVDLIGYRRHGHSEIDDPTITQPALYRKIEGLAPLGAAADVERLRARFEQEQERAKAVKSAPALYRLPSYWKGYRGGPYDAAMERETGVGIARLREIAERITALPPEFAAHPKVRRTLEQRREMVEGKRPVDWGTAEALALGSLLWDGMRVRLSGQDTRRGTFSQRHAVLVDSNTEAEYVPLQHLHAEQGAFECVDSPLSEAAAVGFEYGFSRDYPDGLVLWEAQFGDFANGAQVVLDQFVSAGETKWGLLSGLTLLLPHGCEGQGPEHSSARIERFLQLAADDNWQVCQPSTSAQYFHLLRRQAVRAWRKPLVALTPKSLLRYPPACSDMGAFRHGHFQTVLPDRDVEQADRVILCTGKIAHELRVERARRMDGRTAIVALEQLYPFPEIEIAEALARYGGIREGVWVQEEPANMGALSFVLPRLEAILRGTPFRTVKRSASASPATGSLKAFGIEQATLLAMAFGRNISPPRS